MEIKELIGEYLEAKVYILKKGDHAIIIDSGANPENVKKAVIGSKVDAVLLTHGHFDHSKYCNEYAKIFGCKIYANQNIAKTLQNPMALYSDDGSVISNLSNFIYIEDDTTIQIGDFEIKCFYCPGHSICSECYLIEDKLFAGDVLFDKSIGRTDLVLSDRNMMYNSLCKLENIKFDVAYSGHGNDSNYLSQMKNISVYKRFLSR